MTNTLYNLARMTTTTTGTGTVSLLSAVSGYLTFDDAGVQNGDVVTYAIHEGSNSEVGQGTYTTSGATLSRDTVYASTNNGAQITLSGNAQVFITAAAEDFASLVDASGTPVDSQVAVWTDANTIEGATSLTYDGTSLKANGTLLLQEAAAAAADQAGYGQIWIKNDAPNTLWFTNDVGTDVQIATTGTGYVDTSGTPADNQIAVFTDADTIEGDAGLTYTSGVLQVGSGDSGATVDSGADNFQIKTSATANIGMTISDGGTTSAHRIHFRASDDDFGYILVDHSATTGNPSISLGYNDGVTNLSLSGDHGDDQWVFRTNNAPATTFAAQGDKFIFSHGESDDGMSLIAANGGASRIYFGTPADPDQHFIIGAATSNRITVGIDNLSRYRFETVGIKQLEASAAGTDDAGFGQWWVENTSPNIPKFTDDAGNDYSIVLDTKAQTLTNKTIQGGIWTSGGSTATTSGTTVDVTGIPSWVTEVVVCFDGVSTNGTDPMLIQLGDAGGIETTGYISHVRDDTAGLDSTAGFLVTESTHTAADTLDGEIRLFHIGGNKWAYSSHTVNASDLYVGGGTKTTTATLTQFRLTTTGGTNTFDAGQITVKYS